MSFTKQPYNSTMKNSNKAQSPYTCITLHVRPLVGTKRGKREKERERGGKTEDRRKGLRASVELHVRAHMQHNYHKRHLYNIDTVL